MNTKALRYGGGLGTFSLSDALTSANNYVTQGSALVQNVQKTISSVSPSSPSAQAPPTSSTPAASFSPPIMNPTATGGLSMGAKIGIGVGAVAVLGTIVYVVTRKTKK